MLIHLQVVLLLAVLCVSHVLGFYIPGVAPREYTDNEQVDVKVSEKTGREKNHHVFYFYALIISLLLTINRLSSSPVRGILCLLNTTSCLSASRRSYNAKLRILVGFELVLGWVGLG